MAGITYDKEYEIHYYEVDYRRKASITSIVDFLGDIATRQSEELGVGIDYLKEHGLGWVLYKWNIDIDKYPMYGEKIIIRTCPCSMKKFYAYRTFEIRSCQGELLGKAESIWFLINTERRRPIRVSEDMFKFYGLTIQDDQPIEIEDIQRPSNDGIMKEFTVRYSDIDTNRHVNNEKYIAWSIETVPMDLVLNYTMKNLKVTYEKETTYGETIMVITEVVDDGDNRITLHKIMDREDKELTLLKMFWEKN